MSISGATEMRRRRAWSRRAFSAGHLHRRVEPASGRVEEAFVSPSAGSCRANAFTGRLGGSGRVVHPLQGRLYTEWIAALIYANEPVGFFPCGLMIRRNIQRNPKWPPPPPLFFFDWWAGHHVTRQYLNLFPPGEADSNL